MTPANEIAALNAEHAALHEHVKALVAPVRELQARLAKDSHNRSKPRSSGRGTGEQYLILWRLHPEG
jgi:hypothetical protein